VSPRWLGLLIAGLLGALLGRGLVHAVGGVFVTPSPVDVNVWQVISPGLQGGALHPGRGSHYVDGTLVITNHLFFRADRLVPKVNGVPNEIRLQLSPRSGTVEALLGQPPAGMVHLHPDTHGHQITMRIAEGRLVLESAQGRQILGTVQPERLELSAQDRSARIEQVTVLDAAGEVLLEQNYARYGLPSRALHAGTLMGAVFAMMMLFVCTGRGRIRGLVLGGALSAPVAAVFVVAQDAWLPLLERLYLVDWSPPELSRTALGLSVLPLCVAVVARVIRPAWSRVGAAPRGLAGLWAGLALVALVVRGTSSPWMAGALLWLVLPWWLVKKDRDSALPWLALDLVSLGLVVVIGWPIGLFVGTLWRISVLVGGASVLATRAPRPAVDSLLLLTLAMLPATEAAVRSGPLGAPWDLTQLQEERPSERGWRDPLSSWTGQCGPDGGAQQLSLLVAGGSSVGGAYQYKDDPTASFVAQAHERLCGSLSTGVALTTHNYGRGNRDTFTISRTIQTMLDRTAPDVVALYVGVNDLLASQYPMTRKQREQVRESRSAAVRGAAGLARRLHLVTGLWLAFRDLPDPGARSVPDVPLPDATENFEAIADAVRARGATLILMTEHTRAEQARRLSGYRQVQQQLAQKREDVVFLDVRTAFAGRTDEEMLVDQNHLTRLGGQRLGAYLAQATQPLLQ